jgi:hypothetical protein
MVDGVTPNISATSSLVRSLVMIIFCVFYSNAYPIG